MYIYNIYRYRYIHIYNISMYIHILYIHISRYTHGSRRAGGRHILLKKKTGRKQVDTLYSAKASSESTPHPCCSIIDSRICADTDECKPDMARLKSRFQAFSGSSRSIWKQMRSWMNFHTCSRACACLCFRRGRAAYVHI